MINTCYVMVIYQQIKEKVLDEERVQTEIHFSSCGREKALKATEPTDGGGKKQKSATLVRSRCD